MSRLQIGIVGGSIAGCSAWIELSRQGHSVEVFERSSQELVGRGAGIGTPSTLFDKLVSRDLIDADMPCFHAADHPLVSRSIENPRMGHTALTLPLNMALCNWGDLYRNLRQRVPDQRYSRGIGALALSPTLNRRVELSLSDNTTREFDLVVFADGYRSLGRRHLFPDVDLDYRGYVLWRGVLDERKLTDSDPLETSLYRLHYKGLPGNAVFYFVPGVDGSVRHGERWVNWACYVPVADTDLSEFLIDKSGRQQTASLAPGSMRLEEESRLKELMSIHLPSYYSDIIAGSRDTFAQPIYTVDVPAYYKDRSCLVGDAGSVAPPFTGSGVFKAANNAIDLAEALGGDEDIDAALTKWSKEQSAATRRISILGRQMEQAFVWAAPDFSTMGEQEAQSWWAGAMTFPDDFNYVGTQDES